MKLIIRTEERPKKTTLVEVLKIIFSQKNYNPTNFNENNIIIAPLFNGELFTFKYKVYTNLPIKINIILEIVSGNSSFIDYLIFEEIDNQEFLIAMIEETKTDDSESRNTGVYQRASKFVYANTFQDFQNINKYMLYTSENEFEREPSDTAIFGTKLLKTIGVTIVGKNNYYNQLTCFYSIDDIIDFKNNMRRPPLGNTPILITKSEAAYFISGILSKPTLQGNIAHDPNIGALTLISAALRKLDPITPIYITNHCVSQDYIDRALGNKFLYIASYLNIYLDGLDYNPKKFFNTDKNYWYIENSSEKITTIFLHIVLECIGSKLIYENHAGCERGYFHLVNGLNTALPKRVNNKILYIPDLIMQLPLRNILLIEGKKLITLNLGIKELQNYTLLEECYLREYNSPIERWVTTFGGNLSSIPRPEVLLHINYDGRIFINENSNVSKLIIGTILYLMRNSQDSY